MGREPDQTLISTSVTLCGHSLHTLTQGAVVVTESCLCGQLQLYYDSTSFSNYKFVPVLPLTPDSCGTCKSLLWVRAKCWSCCDSCHDPTWATRVCLVGEGEGRLLICTKSLFNLQIPFFFFFPSVWFVFFETSRLTSGKKKVRGARRTHPTSVPPPIGSYQWKRLLKCRTNIYYMYSRYCT